MTTIESSVQVNKPVSEVYSFLEDMNNHQQLMPENITNWTSTKEQASFTIQNMGKLSIKISERVENQSLTAVPAEKAPFDIELKWVLEEEGNNTMAKLIISADLNMMMKMLASGPLKKLAEHQATRLKEVLA